MIKTISITAALLTLASAASPATAGTRLNALTNNGTRLNALTNNGTRLNAITANGAAVTGAAAAIEPVAVVPAVTSVRLSDGTIVTLR